MEVIVFDEPYDEKIHKNENEMDVMVVDGTMGWHLKLNKQVVWPIKRLIVAVTKKTQAKRIEKDQIVMIFSPSMEIL